VPFAAVHLAVGAVAYGSVALVAIRLVGDDALREGIDALADRLRRALGRGK